MRERWRQMSSSWDPRRLVFIDETGAKTNMTRIYGRAPRGERIREGVPTAHWGTTTLVAAVRADGPCAPFMFEGAMDGDAFCIYIEKVLVPALRPGDIVIMDNLSSHKAPPVRPLVEAAGAIVLDLPSYSPDLNPIEKMWSKVKTLVRRAKARTMDELVAAVANALAKVTPTDIEGWFRSCGYTLN